VEKHEGALGPMVHNGNLTEQRPGRIHHSLQRPTNEIDPSDGN